MSPQSHCHPTASQKAAGHKFPECPTCAESSWWHLRGREPTAGVEELDVLLVEGVTSRSFQWHARRHGPSCGTSDARSFWRNLRCQGPSGGMQDIHVLLVVREMLRSLWLQTRHRGLPGRAQGVKVLLVGCESLRFFSDLLRTGGT